MKRGGWAQGLYDQSVSPKEILGQERDTPDGRKFVYARAGATALAVGIPTISPAMVANHTNCQCAAAAIGDTVVSVTLGATAATADQYKHGYLQVNDGTGQGYQYLITSNTAADASGVTIVTLADPIRVALVASATSEVSLVYNPFTGIVVSAANGHFAGVPVRAVTALYYYWSQIGGVCCALNTNAVAVGTELAVGTAIFVAASAYTTEVVATAYATAGITDEYKPVFLKKR